ncbi:MAG: type II toxin-antitoxin system HigA family antitoxin [Legionellales bacterium]
MNTVISRKKYAQLLADRLPRVIESQKEHERVISEIQKLMMQENTLTPEEKSLLQLMVLLVQDYEQRQFNLDTGSITPLAMLKHLMEAHEHTAKDLWEVIGDKGTVSKILSGGRHISKTMAKQLGKLYSVSPALFI